MVSPGSNSVRRQHSYHHLPEAFYFQGITNMHICLFAQRAIDITDRPACRPFAPRLYLNVDGMSVEYIGIDHCRYRTWIVYWRSGKTKDIVVRLPKEGQEIGYKIRNRAIGGPQTLQYFFSS